MCISAAYRRTVGADPAIGYRTGLLRDTILRLDDDATIITAIRGRTLHRGNFCWVFRSSDGESRIASWSEWVQERGGRQRRTMIPQCSSPLELSFSLRPLLLPPSLLSLYRRVSLSRAHALVCARCLRAWWSPFVVVGVLSPHNSLSVSLFVWSSTPRHRTPVPTATITSF